MKKFLILAIPAMLLLNAFNAYATIRRVGYPGNPVSGTDYSGDYNGVNGAIGDSNGGDTILLFPGYYFSGFYSIYPQTPIAINKKIVMLSYGYFVNVKHDSTRANANLQNIYGNMYVFLDVQNGGDGSIFKGIDGLTIYVDAMTSVSNIVINRCNVSNIHCFDNVACYNWQITQCYLNSLDGENTTGFASESPNFSNLYVGNCYLHKIDLSSFSYGGSLNGGFFNNIFDGTCNFNNGAFQVNNNIF